MGRHRNNKHYRKFPLRQGFTGTLWTQHSQLFPMEDELLHCIHLLCYVSLRIKKEF